MQIIGISSGLRPMPAAPPLTLESKFSLKLEGFELEETVPKILSRISKSPDGHKLALKVVPEAT